ncbi:MAG TPA: ABC transporter permease [Hypericibacter adhaerens]|jgi:ribose transport system permease protein|uniref:ABC transporter permease n=1 Tax=Hypericibacter adhaerens TaxID=2602016 RepID=A0A5J6MY22_9PROT|nr:ABC transporter permease [Hypericibacter adhaerens]QEX21833.1 ABC transporter permease [Hypericibacter adhaerens]HWA46161.1 ABC transporter permease [Hypericibacter adhaerens]
MATTTGVRKSGYKPSQATIVLGLTLVLFVALSAGLPGFLTLGNFFTLARGVSILGILALGMAVVVIGRGIDLSQIATLAVSAAIAVTLINAGAPVLVGLFAGLVLAIAIGVLNGYLISVVEIPALFTTLATALFALGVTRALVVPHYQVFLEPGHDWFLALGGTLADGLPVPVIVFAVCAVLLHLFLSRTVLGRFIYAHGDNAQAARLSGIATRPLTMLEYGLCSAIGYVGGVVMVASTSLIHLQIAESTMIFDVILVVVLGGVSLVGGRGNVVSVIAGTLLIGVLLNAMTIMNLDVQTQDMIKGAVLLCAIMFDSYVHPRDEETAKQGD